MNYKWKFVQNSGKSALNNIIIASDGGTFKDALLEASKHVNDNSVFSFSLARVEIPPDILSQGKPPVSIRIYKNPLGTHCTWTLGAYDNPERYKSIYNSYILKCETDVLSQEDPEKSLLTFFKFLKLEAFAN
jgi:hypothetical protein